MQHMLLSMRVLYTMLGCRTDINNQYLFKNITPQWTAGFRNQPRGEARLGSHDSRKQVIAYMQ